MSVPSRLRRAALPILGVLSLLGLTFTSPTAAVATPNGDEVTGAVTGRVVLPEGFTFQDAWVEALLVKADEAPTLEADMDEEVQATRVFATTATSTEPDQLEAETLMVPVAYATEVEEDGTYLIADVEAGKYVLKFQPVEASNNEVVPTWWENAENFEDADVLDVEANEVTGMEEASLAVVSEVQIEADADDDQVHDAAEVEPGPAEESLESETQTKPEPTRGPSASPFDQKKSRDPSRGPEAENYVENGRTTAQGLAEQREEARQQHAKANQHKEVERQHRKALATSEEVSSSFEAAGTASIRGKITVPSGVDVTNVWVWAYDTESDWDWLGFARANPDGTYEITGLDAGTYRVEFDSYEENVITQWWNNKPDFDSATDITLIAGGSKTNVNATLKNGATITGKVTVPPGTDLTEVTVDAYDENYFWTSYADVDSSGNYKLEGLPAGTYRLEFESFTEEIARQWYEDAEDFESATPIPLGSEEDKTVRNVTLKKGATISGVVQVPAGVDVANTEVALYDSSGYWVDFIYPGDDGAYAFHGLHAGTYYVEFASDEENVLAQWWNNKPDFNSADPIPLTTGGAKTDVNATLKKGATISGKITAPADVNLTNIEVTAYDEEWNWVSHTNAKADGTYHVVGLPAGTYRVEFSSGEENILTQWWNNKPDFDSATDITLTAEGSKTNVNATLKKGAAISGKITVPTGVDVEAINVNVYSADWEWVSWTAPNEDGTYRVIGLPQGTYKVEFTADQQDAAPQWWNNKPDFGSANEIVLTAGGSKTNVNATLKNGAAISGKITVPTGVNVENIVVSAIGVDGPAEAAFPEVDGTYKILGLSAGTYKVEFSSYIENVAPQWWNNKESEREATPVTLTATQHRTEVNATLQKGATISGKVTVPTGYTATDVRVVVLNDARAHVGYAVPEDNGEFEVVGLGAGEYKALFYHRQETLLPEWWDNKASFEFATGITLTAGGSKTNVNVSMKVGEQNAFALVPTPRIWGDPKVGATLRVINGTKWDFLPTATSASYQWFRDGAAIQGATGSIYKLVAADAGTKITFKVTGKRTGFTNRTATSAAVIVEGGAPSPQLEVRRLSGVDRYGTNVAVNSRTAPVGKPVFVAAGGSFPDALSAGPAVRSVGGSLFLTPTKSMPTTTLNAIKALNPSTVYIIGGRGAVSDGVAGQLRSATGKTPIRVSGPSRYETSEAVFKRFFPGTQPLVFIATGRDYPDALTGSAAGGALGAPVLLVNGNNPTAPTATTLMRNAGTQNVQIVGGKGAVSVGIESSFKSQFGSSKVGRLSGSDRYATNMAVNNYLGNQPGDKTIHGIWLATGKNFPDALSAAVPAGAMSERLVLSNGNCIPKPVVTTWIKGTNSQVNTVTLVGGTGVLNNNIYTLKQCG